MDRSIPTVEDFSTYRLLNRDLCYYLCLDIQIVTRAGSYEKVGVKWRLFGVE